ncbi:MAG TPA: SpoIID/LytB domain-containing protein [Gaiellaceae bacterium]|nr:SpoIID/LytB domain-containing protein [Gaiellaceae bacterium]
MGRTDRHWLSRPWLVRLAACALLLFGGVSSGLLAATGRLGTTTSVATGTGTSAAGPTTTTNPARVVLAVSGHGWGHGLGLSQWGAYGYAKHGWTYDRILGHYYTGTTLGHSAISTIRVQLVDAKKAVLASSADWTATDAAGHTTKLAPGKLTLTKALVVDGTPLTPPVTFASAEPLVVGGRPYRGSLVVTLDGKQVEVVDDVSLESYLDGVVPSEMPSKWPAEALKAQAVAARSYALANLKKKGDFDVYGDGRDQIYGGVAAESPAASEAVAATKGVVVLYGGKVADTMFFSSSGGRTASAADAMDEAIPYLVSVADPYDAVSPYHDWGPVLVNGVQLAKQLKLAGPIADLAATPGSDGRVRSFVVTGAAGAQVTLTGAQARADLGLDSTWFTASLLALQPGKTMTYGGAVTLTGTVRGATGVSLESRVGAGAWQPAGAVSPGADGTFSVLVRPAQTTQFRLAWGDVRAGLARVGVAPAVSVQAAAGVAVGSIRPAVAGAVQLQKQDPATSAWSTLATGTSDSTGAFRIQASLTPGTYRVRAAPGHGLAPGLSAPFQVS